MQRGGHMRGQVSLSAEEKKRGGMAIEPVLEMFPGDLLQGGGE